MSAAFARIATATATTKRNPAPVAGKVGAAVAYLAGLAVTPVMPVSKQIIEMYRLNSPRETYVTYADGSPDVVEGDEMTIDGVTYFVRGAQPWPGTPYLEIVIERVVGI